MLVYTVEKLQFRHVRLRERRGTRRAAKILPCERSLNVKQTLGSVNVKQTLRFFMNTKLTFSPRVNVQVLYAERRLSGLLFYYYTLQL